MPRIKKESRSKPGILYVVLIELEGKSLVKIGVTHRSIEERVSEILVGIFKGYREFPYARPKRYRKTTDIYEKEKTLHKHFSKYKYKTTKKFGGCTEFFDVPLDDVVKVYDEMIKSGTCKKKGVFFTVNKNV